MELANLDETIKIANPKGLGWEIYEKLQKNSHKLGQVNF